MNLESPAWLLVWIAVPVLAVLAVLIGRVQKRPWEIFVAERLRGKLIKREHPLPSWLAFGFLLVAILALVLTMARPQGDAGTKTQTTEGRNVMIVLDLSRSMRVQDVNPDRLGQAKVIIYELLETLSEDRVGLVGFAGSPFLFAPLTIDHAAVQETVEQIDEEWVSRGGSDLSAGIQLGTETLKETGQKNNTMILISDGEENAGDLDTIIADAERAGVRIFAIGVGTEDGGFVPHPNYPDGLRDRNGNRIVSRLESGVMRRLATETGGTYVIAGRGADIPAMVEAAVQGMDVFEIEGGETRIVVEFFQWVLAPAIFFLMAAIVTGTRWRGIARGASALLLLSLVPDAFGGSVKDARAAFSEERYDEARDAFRKLAEEKGNAEKRAVYRLGEGLAAYEADDFRGARTAYSEALLSKDEKIVGKAHEGMANTLFQLGWLGLSGNRYPQGKDAPDMEEFDEMVREQLARMADAEVPETGESSEFIRLDSIILNWSDAVRHYQSAVEKNPADGTAMKNQEVAMQYLERLRDLLQEEKEQTEQEMPQPDDQQGQGDGDGDDDNEGSSGDDESEQGQDEGDEDSDGDGKDDDDSDGDDGTGDQEEDQDGDKGEGEDKENEGEDSEGEEGENPNESPEERARRKLSENQDLEKGSLAPGRREITNPEHDY